ncbi:hypothetical protein H0H93_001631 [Arthromyces matolae]|nr:hypothetical protein H0H93_001631 [Arthromyces matolae]
MPTYEYLSVAGVCDRWRRVALQCPSLWTSIYHCSAEWLKEIILPRSGTLPFYINIPVGVVDDTVRKVLFPRAGDLTLWAIGAIEPRLLETHLSCLGPAQHLLCLEIRMTIGCRINLPQSTPALRRLVLVNTLITATSPLYIHLTHLILKSLRKELSTTIGELLGILRSASALQSLEISDVVVSPAVPGQMEHIPLPTLEQLRLSGTIFLTGEILARISWPLKHLGINITASTGEITSRLKPIQSTEVRRKLASFVLLPYDLGLGSIDEHCISSSGDGEDGQPKTLQYKDQRLSEIDCVLLSSLVFDHLHSLNLAACLPTDYIIEKFGNLTTLSVVHIIGDADSFLCILENLSTPFHALESLRLSGQTPLSTGKPRIDTSRLATVLEFRQLQGCPIHNLSVEGYVHNRGENIAADHLLISHSVTEVALWDVIDEGVQEAHVGMA